MTKVQIEKAHKLLEAVKKLEMDLHTGGCRILSLGGGCTCILCVCDELRELLRSQAATDSQGAV